MLHFDMDTFKDIWGYIFGLVLFFLGWAFKTYDSRYRKKKEQLEIYTQMRKEINELNLQLLEMTKQYREENDILQKEIQELKTINEKLVRKLDKMKELLRKCLGEDEVSF